MQRPCVFCGKEFQVDTSRRNWNHVKLCSDDCRRGLAAKKKQAEYRPKKLVERPCAECGTRFVPARGGAGRQIYCSRECFLKKRAGEAHAKWSDEVRKRLCSHCQGAFVPKKFGGGRQIYCTLACQVRAINSRRERPERSIKYQREFKIMKPLVLARDKVCVLCGSPNKLHVHHWDNSGQFPHCDNSLDNLAALCGRCHKEIHMVTLVKVNGSWAINGSIFKKIAVAGPLPIHR